MAELISHKGRVVSADSKKVSVEIVSESACAACHAAGLCGMSESRKKIVEVPAPAGMEYVPGQEVEVCLAPKTGLKAVLPVMFLLILILSLSLIGLGELAAGVISILGVALYYLILYLFKDRLAEGYEFFIRR